MPRHRVFRVLLASAAFAAVSRLAGAQTPLQEPPRATSAELRDMRYDVTYDHTTAPQRIIKVSTTMAVVGSGPVVLSLPEWTPGAYEISNFARFVVDFAATGDGRALSWSKQAFESWRLEPAGAKSLTVSFSVAADTLDNAMAW